jgi:isochorismate hydrolase
MTKRLAPDHCLGAIIDVQEYFLLQVEKQLRSRLKANINNFAQLLRYFEVPTIVTLERPIDQKGRLPAVIGNSLGGIATTFEKDFFDLTKEKKIRHHLASLKKKQVIVAGCETDVCVLQSCLGLLNLGYEVFVVEELLFSSAHNVASAIARMKSEGAVVLTYKTLYYELIEAVEGCRHSEKMLDAYGPFPDELPDVAAH